MFASCRSDRRPPPRRRLAGGFAQSWSSALRHLLRRQPLDDPLVIRLPRVTKTVVETVGAALPELDALRREHITAPVGRTRYFVRAKARFGLLPLRLQLRTVWHNLTLGRSPRREPAAQRSRLKIGGRLSSRKFADFTGNADLPFQISPIKNKSRLRVFRQLLSFAAVIVGEKNEAAFINAFEQNDARRGSARFVSS